MNKEDVVWTCKFNSECLELIANRLSLVYVVSIFSSIVIGLILLGDLFENQVKFHLGIFGLSLAIIPLIFKEKIEKVHGYHELSGMFKNLGRDFSGKDNAKRNSETLKNLTQKLADYPIDGYTKWKINKKLKKNKK